MRYVVLMSSLRFQCDVTLLVYKTSLVMMNLVGEYVTEKELTLRYSPEINRTRGHHTQISVT